MDSEHESITIRDMHRHAYENMIKYTHVRKYKNYKQISKIRICELFTKEFIDMYLPPHIMHKKYHRITILLENDTKLTITMRKNMVFIVTNDKAINDIKSSLVIFR